MNIEFTIKNEKILLRADSFNYELCRLVNRTDRDTGETFEEWAPFKFFASLGQALNRIVEMKVRASDARTLSELKADIEEARDEVCRVWDTTNRVNC